MINADMIRADMAKMGVTAQQVSESMGVNKNYITNALGRKIVSEQVVWKIENALFKPQGTYCLPISKEPVAEEPKATPNADLRAILARLEKIEQKIPQEDTEKKMKELSVMPGLHLLIQEILLNRHQVKLLFQYLFHPL